jgi:hypothetical protein
VTQSIASASIWLAVGSESEHDRGMVAIAFLFVRMLNDCFKSGWQRKAEILV